VRWPQHYSAGKAVRRCAGPGQIGIGIGEGARIHVQCRRRQPSALAYLDGTGVSVGRRVGDQGLRGGRTQYAEVPDGCQAGTGGSRQQRRHPYRVAHALVRAVSRLVSTPWRGTSVCIDCRAVPLDRGRRPRWPLAIIESLGFSNERAAPGGPAQTGPQTKGSAPRVPPNYRVRARHRTNPCIFIAHQSTERPSAAPPVDMLMN
jgi:hypothetical protein